MPTWLAASSWHPQPRRRLTDERHDEAEERHDETGGGACLDDADGVGEDAEQEQREAGDHDAVAGAAPDVITIDGAGGGHDHACAPHECLEAQAVVAMTEVTKAVAGPAAVPATEISKESESGPVAAVEAIAGLAAIPAAEVTEEPSLACGHHRRGHRRARRRIHCRRGLQGLRVRPCVYRRGLRPTPMANPAAMLAPRPIPLPRPPSPRRSRSKMRGIVGDCYCSA
jgi:hypothetical protein